ncbi:MAG: DUF58 domain-containing protein [Huintestinicola sp.]|uniref:hypothetical protein n=1 Tax=Huintestinicola sp. TaxID=2981661 RepID=UPI003F118A32
MKMKINKLKPLLGGLVNYFAAVALAVIFALFLSGRVGWFLVTAFVAAPVISVLMTLMFVRRIYVSCDADSVIMCKGDSCELTVNVTNGVFLPTPPVLADMSDLPSVTASEKHYSISVLPFDTESFTVCYKAVICGPAVIGVKSLRVSDYFGIFSFEIKSADISEMTYTVSVIPDIVRVNFSDPVVSRAAELSAFADDSEDTTDAPAGKFGGFPGYDSREYVPGDPLKRINWKQSAKRGKLLVRLDDETVSSAVSIVLDSVFDKESVFLPAVAAEGRFLGAENEALTALMAQDAIEHSLGITRAFIMQNYSVSYFLMGKNGWECFPAADENDLAALRTELASYSFLKTGTRFPEEELKNQKGSVSVFCTPYLDNALNEQLSSEAADGRGALQTVIYPSAVSPRVNSPKGGEAE